MRQIMVDFNTLNSTPIDVLKLGVEGTPNGDRLSDAQPGERVQFYDDEILVEGTLKYDIVEGRRFWLGYPEWSTRQQTPPELAALVFEPPA